MADGFNHRAGHICPTCHKKVGYRASYSQPVPGHDLYHFECRYPPRATQPAVKQPPQQEQLFHDPTPTHPIPDHSPP